jgi:hypothetical protein
VICLSFTRRSQSEGGGDSFIWNASAWDFYWTKSKWFFTLIFQEEKIYQFVWRAESNTFSKS